LSIIWGGISPVPPQVDWVNGTVSHSLSDARGKIVFIHHMLRAPYEHLLRPYHEQQPLAIIIGVPPATALGGGLGTQCYQLDGKERNSINFPVAIGPASTDNNFTNLAENSMVSIQFEENKWKTYNENPDAVIVGCSSISSLHISLNTF
jgi:hypothetical protein